MYMYTTSFFFSLSLSLLLGVGKNARDKQDIMSCHVHHSASRIEDRGVEGLLLVLLNSYLRNMSVKK